MAQLPSEGARKARLGFKLGVPYFGRADANRANLDALLNENRLQTAKEMEDAARTERMARISAMLPEGSPTNMAAVLGEGLSSNQALDAYRFNAAPQIAPSALTAETSANEANTAANQFNRDVNLGQIPMAKELGSLISGVARGKATADITTESNRGETAKGESEDALEKGRQKAAQEVAQSKALTNAAKALYERSQASMPDQARIGALQGELEALKGADQIEMMKGLGTPENQQRRVAGEIATSARLPITAAQEAENVLQMQRWLFDPNASEEQRSFAGKALMVNKGVPPTAIVQGDGFGQEARGFDRFSGQFLPGQGAPQGGAPGATNWGQRQPGAAPTGVEMTPFQRALLNSIRPQ